MSDFKNLRKLLQTTWGQRVIVFALPFLVRPSEFTSSDTHRLYGRVRGISVVPLVSAAWFFWIAFGRIASNEMKQFDWGTSSTPRVIDLSMSFVAEMKWTASGLCFALVMLAAGLRWGFHFCMRRIMARRQTEISIGAAPFNFFLFHTSGAIAWLGLWMVIIAVAGTLSPGHQFEFIDTFIRKNALLVLALVGCCLLFRQNWKESDQAMLRDIYSQAVLIAAVRRVRGAVWGMFGLANVVAFVVMAHQVIPPHS